MISYTCLKVDVGLAGLFISERGPLASIHYEDGRRGPLLLIWYNFRHSMEKLSNTQCGMKLHDF